MTTSMLLASHFDPNTRLKITKVNPNGDGMQLDCYWINTFWLGAT